jgi:K+-sensing histidine kinase KdpD
MEQNKVSAAVKFVAGMAVCPIVAVLLTLLLRDGDPIRLAAPAICLQVVIVTALFVGRLPAAIGAVLSAITFAVWLFPPYGSFWIHDPTERIVLALFQLTAVIIALVSPGKSSRNGWKL